MEYKSFNISQIGASHIKRGTECQDASISFSNEDYSVIIVCDGHGGDNYIRSSKGSDIAKKVAFENIKEFIENFKKIETLEKDKEYYNRLMYSLKASIISSWNEKVKDDVSKNPFTEDELNKVSEGARKRYLNGDIESAYGTTMIAVAYTENYCFAIQIGDGKCIFINSNGEFNQPVPVDDKCFLNVTTSICDKDAIDSFRHIFIEKLEEHNLPVAVFIGTDGVDDSFQNDQQLYELYRTVLYSFSNTEFEEAYKELENYIPTLSKHGSGDDISIASILDIENIKELDFIKNFEKDLLGNETSETQNDNEENMFNITNVDSIKNESLEVDKKLKIKIYDKENFEEIDYPLEENNFLEKEISEITGNYKENISEEGNNSAICDNSFEIKNEEATQVYNDKNSNCFKEESINSEEIDKLDLSNEINLECTENNNLEEEKLDILQKDDIPQISESKENLTDESEKVAKKGLRKKKFPWKFF